MKSNFNIGDTIRRNQKDKFGALTYKDHFILSKIENGYCELNRVNEEQKRIEGKETMKKNSIFQRFFPNVQKNIIKEYDQVSPPIVCSVAQLNKLFESVN